MARGEVRSLDMVAATLQAMPRTCTSAFIDWDRSEPGGAAVRYTLICCGLPSLTDGNWQLVAMGDSRKL